MTDRPNIINLFDQIRRDAREQLGVNLNIEHPELSDQLLALANGPCRPQLRWLASRCYQLLNQNAGCPQLHKSVA